MKNCVYRFVNNQGDIIYIGKAKCLKTRLSNHKHLPEECYLECDKIEFMMFDTEYDMDLAERYFIPRYKPKYNTDMKNNNISLHINDLEIKMWKSYNKIEEVNKINNNKEDLLDCDVEFLKREKTIISAKLDMIDNLLDKYIKDEGMRKDIINERHDLIKKENEYKEKLLNILKIRYPEERTFVLEYFIYLGVSSKDDIIKYNIKELIEKHYKICETELLEKGYYREENYEKIDNDFIYYSFKQNKWLYLLEGRYTKCNIESYLVDRDIKNKIIADIIKNIEHKLIHKYGLFEKEIIMLDSYDQVISQLNHGFEPKKFKKPYIVYKIA